MTDYTPQILNLVNASPVIHYEWENRGIAPRGYINGMVLTFASVYLSSKQGDKYVAEMSKANTHDASKDALAYYAGIFDIMKMNNDVAGADTLRHLWTLLIGLGMRESSGQYCCGRDRSADNVTSDTAEAGAFQASWNAHVANPLMLDLFTNWKLSGLANYFHEGVHCSTLDLANYGSGNGYKFQALCKSDPSFAAWFAAIGLRNLKSHWGPIIRREAEVRHDVDVLLQGVQKIVDSGELVA